MSPLTIVFDLDGTLIDTAPDLVDTLNLLLLREGLPQVPYETARKMIGGGAKAMLARGLAAEGASVAPDRLDGLLKEFIAHYSAHIADRSRPFPGLADALDALAAQGHRFAVCTNKLEWLSRQLLDALGLSQRFRAICGQDTFGIQKPNAEILLRTVATAGGDIRRAIMVGDSATDIQTARAAAIPVIAVDFGYSEEPVVDLAPDCTISRYEQLPAAVASIEPKLGRKPL